ncbi:MarR family transcriptional regulator [Microbacterium sp. Marseille-Q6648]|uniref:MarR family winged helix-turn-helix transcriptional regulator n=1 Tax=Microbacterium sp. Marseille-Q6648 TaxID=2937991 RepID=UPI00203B5073|nr:MarR family transcriptional regulator [Microbacterium sp. Marseille-Q6648]
MFEDEITRFSESAADDLGMLLMDAASTVVAATIDRLSAGGHTRIRPGHVPVFARIDPEGTTISTLASRAGVSRQAMSVVVRELEEHGYVQTAPDAHDRRATRVELTARGAALCRDATRISGEIAAGVAAELGPGRVAELRATLRHLTAGTAAPA